MDAAIQFPLKLFGQVVSGSGRDTANQDFIPTLRLQNRDIVAQLIAPDFIDYSHSFGQGGDDGFIRRINFFAQLFQGAGKRDVVGMGVLEFDFFQQPVQPGGGELLAGIAQGGLFFSPCEPGQPFFTDTFERARHGPWFPDAGPQHIDITTDQRPGSVENLCFRFSTAGAGNDEFATGADIPGMKWSRYNGVFPFIKSGGKRLVLQNCRKAL